MDTRENFRILVKYILSHKHLHRYLSSELLSQDISFIDTSTCTSESDSPIISNYCNTMDFYGYCKTNNTENTNSLFCLYSVYGIYTNDIDSNVIFNSKNILMHCRHNQINNVLIFTNSMYICPISVMQITAAKIKVTVFRSNLLSTFSIPPNYLIEQRKFVPRNSTIPIPISYDKKSDSCIIS